MPAKMLACTPKVFLTTKFSQIIQLKYFSLFIVTTNTNITLFIHTDMKKGQHHEFLEMDINTDVLDKETTYNPLLDGFKSDGSGIGRKDTQALSGKIIKDTMSVV